jgi:ribosome modulation factor
MTPEQFEKSTGLSGRKSAALIGVSPARYRRWRNGEVRIPEDAQKELQRISDKIVFAMDGTRKRRLSDIQPRVKQMIIDECYQAGFNAKRKKDCPYGADLGRRCAWLAGYYDSGRK